MIAATPTVVVPAATFVQGDDHHYPEERPARSVAVAEFRIDVHPVTNAQFAAFVDATGHVTAAESRGGAVFVRPSHRVDLADPSEWWQHRESACWRRPDGTHDITGEDLDHPVVHVDRRDAAAYAAWAGTRLPTESEWERAACGASLPETWPLEVDGMLLANVWLGEFPVEAIRTRPPGTSPVGAFPPNELGLFDMLGNVWEWTSDAWVTTTATCCGPVTADSSPAGVVKGGSFLCAANYCARYRPSARHRQLIGEATCHIGFRCAVAIGTVDA
jgi:formylglycine-generating enzyme